jgi:hypothetical protein
MGRKAKRDTLYITVIAGIAINLDGDRAMLSR